MDLSWQRVAEIVSTRTEAACRGKFKEIRLNCQDFREKTNIFVIRFKWTAKEKRDFISALESFDQTGDFSWQTVANIV